ncbi:sperm-associated antigen 16 protein [Antennarius striatus]|uniref:sperm-associated antigen 16 protein n=1 Tax=Antennarius striatus TaxID=241820 RepID=UPI0035AF6380
MEATVEVIKDRPEAAAKPDSPPVSHKPESEADFQYKEVSSEDDWSSAEDEEDLEATAKATENQAEATAAHPNSAPVNHKPESVDHFLRRFLVEFGMMETLECFQSEWSDMVQEGSVCTEQLGVVSHVYTDIMRLHSELKNAQREEAECKLEASAAAGTLELVQKARDFYRMKHNRIDQIRNKLIEEMKRLKVQCDSYDSELQRMRDKYHTVLKQTTQMSLERDKDTEE